MKLGMSTNCFIDHSAARLIELYKKTQAFSYLEIWNENGYFTRSLKSDKELSEMFIRAGIEIGSIHTPFSHWPQKGKMVYIEKLKASLTKAKIFGADYVVVHPMRVSTENWERDQSLTHSMPESLAFWKEIVDVAAEFNIQIAFENLGRSKHWPDGCSPEFLVEMIHSIEKENAGICLDFSHCFALGHDVIEMIKKYGNENILGIHASDGIYARKADEHLLPSEGELDWRAMFKVLKDLNYTGRFNLEVKGLKDEPQFIKSTFDQIKKASETV